MTSSALKQSSLFRWIPWKTSSVYHRKIRREKYLDKEWRFFFEKTFRFETFDIKKSSSQCWVNPLIRFSFQFLQSRLQDLQVFFFKFHRNNLTLDWATNTIIFNMKIEMLTRDKEFSSVLSIRNGNWKLFTLTFVFCLKNVRRGIFFIYMSCLSCLWVQSATTV